MSNRNYIFNSKKRVFTMFNFSSRIRLNTSVNYGEYYAECQKYVNDAVV